MIKRARVIGMPVAAGTLDTVAEEVLRTAHEKRGGYVCLANVHMLTTARRDERLHSVLEQASCVATDGMPLVWILLGQGIKHAERVAGADLLERLFAGATKDRLSIYFYGGDNATISSLCDSIGQRFPGLRIAGAESPPILPDVPELDVEVVERIKRTGADIVLVGLGCPKQEFWMSIHAPYLPSVLIGVGAAFDFLAGTKKRAPLLIQRCGMEWLYRLLCEPRRLWKRYLVTNTLFIWYLISDFSKGKTSTGV